MYVVLCDFAFCSAAKFAVFGLSMGICIVLCTDDVVVDCQGEANIGSVEEFGKTVLVTEKRSDSRGSKSGLVVIRVSMVMFECTLES